MRPSTISVEPVGTGDGCEARQGKERATSPAVPWLPAPPVIRQTLSVSSGTMVDPPDVTRGPFNRSSGRRATAVEGAEF